MRFDCRLLVLAGILLLTACEPKSKPERLTQGQIVNSVYHNQYFKLTLRVPMSEGWKADLRPPALMYFTDFYLHFLAGKWDEPRSKDRVVRMMVMLTAPVESMTGKDAIVMVGAARVGDRPGVDRWFARTLTESLLLDQAARGKILGDFRMTLLGDAPFTVCDIEWAMKNGRFLEARYLAILRDYALVFSVVATGREGLERGKKVLEAVEFSMPGTRR